jgi:hypothetical protein
MNKGVLVGGGLGLLMLVLLGSYWLTARAPEPEASLLSKTAPGLAPPSGASNPSAKASQGSTPSEPTTSTSGSDASASATPPDPSKPAPWNAAPVEPNAPSDKKPLTREERRKIRAEVRVKMSELLAKGQSVTPAETQAFLNDVEKLGQGMFDPRYFSTMREMVRYSARTQDLSRELGQIANSKEPKDLARQTEILAEMRNIGDLISNGAAALQSYARDTTAGKKP